MADPPCLTLDRVCVTIGGQAVLDGITLSVARGAFIALVGPSGSGKTTLLKTVNRLRAVDTGRIMLFGEDVGAMAPPLLRRQIGYVFQEIGLFPHLTVAENIAMPLRVAGVTIDGRQERVRAMLDLVGLPADFGGRYPQSLSGGQAQRVGVARSLANEQRLILMDEPFGALDPVTRAELGKAYRALHDRVGLTTIMVTHDMAEAMLLADRIIVLIGGRVRADADPATLARGVDDPDVRALTDAALGQARALAALGEGA